MDEPQWMVTARKYLGMREVKGPQHNPGIIALWKKMGVPFTDDETPWCGGFVGGVLVESGLKAAPGGAMARNWLKLQKRIERPAVGCVVVFWRGAPQGASGHVGFVVGQDRAGNLAVLGGNQGDKVSIAFFPRSRVLGYRWPSIAPSPERYNLPIYESNGQLSTNEA